MASELSKIYQEALQDPMPYFHFNTKRAEVMQEQLQKLSGNEALVYRYFLAREFLWAGQTEKAISILENLIDETVRTPGIIDQNNRPLYDELALAYLRLGEQQNCILHHRAGSCIMPITGDGWQTLQDGTRKAIDLYQNILRSYPDDYGSRWLLNVANMSIGEYPEAVPVKYLIKELSPQSKSMFPRFSNVAVKLGLAVNGLSGGLSIEDYNGDHHLDILITSYGLPDSSHYFQADGQGGYVDRTSEAGIKDLVSGLNLVHADYDNDDDVDVLILRGAWHADAGDHPNSLLRNNGDGTFEDVTFESGLISYHPTQTASWGDFNLDGNLDLFIGNESINQWQDVLAKNRQGTGKSHPSELFLNNGDGTFTNVAERVGIHLETFVKGVVWGDINNDGLPDLYVSIMGEPNKLYVNRGGITIEDWQFEEKAKEAGVELPFFSFPTWFWDFDNDGWEDLLVLSYDFRHFTQLHTDIGREYMGFPVEAEISRLYRNNGDETFTDMTVEAGLNKTMFSMGSNFGDLDNDGWLDFYVGTGAPDLRSIVPNRMFSNVEGKRFEEVTLEGGFGHIQKGHAVAFADLDRDGDQDIYAVMGGAVEGDVFPNVLFENPDGWNDNSWITLEFVGSKANRSAIGTRIELTVEDKHGIPRKITRTVGTGGSFGAGSLQQEIGLGQAQVVKELKIKWPELPPKTETHSDLLPNRYYLIVEDKPPQEQNRPAIPFHLEK